ncbi:MAG: FAD-binding oxidoreductase [Marinilabiliales bacterium]|nr:FAD-binding oxidoreductase [Marinilabiliales bacterium]
MPVRLTLSSAPGSHEEVEKLIELLQQRTQVPVIPLEWQSSVTGALKAPEGGIALDLTKHLNRILRISTVNKTVTVQAGISGPSLEAELNSNGYTCGHFPQSFEYSTAGGWIACEGAGQASTGYGKIEDMVVALRAVTPAGVIETKDYPRTAQGWDLFRLFIGSEGTLGVITEITLRIHITIPVTPPPQPSSSAHSDRRLRPCARSCIASTASHTSSVSPTLTRLTLPS